jgi:hypothetical protein
VKSDVHSTDTHGYSEMIFGTMLVGVLGFWEHWNVMPSSGLCRVTCVKLIWEQITGDFTPHFIVARRGTLTERFCV